MAALAGTISDRNTATCLNHAATPAWWRCRDIHWRIWADWAYPQKVGWLNIVQHWTLQCFALPNLVRLIIAIPRVSFASLAVICVSIYSTRYLSLAVPLASCASPFQPSPLVGVEFRRSRQLRDYLRPNKVVLVRRRLAPKSSPLFLDKLLP